MTEERRLCSANRDAVPCFHYAARGSRYCRRHGGESPKAKAFAAAVSISEMKTVKSANISAKKFIDDIVQNLPIIIRRAWIAGFIESGGSFCINRTKVKDGEYTYNLQVRLCSCNPDIILLVTEEFAGFGAIYYVKGNGKKKDLTRWIASGRLALNFIKEIESYFMTDAYKQLAALAVVFMQAKELSDTARQEAAYREFSSLHKRKRSHE